MQNQYANNQSQSMTCNVCVPFLSQGLLATSKGVWKRSVYALLNGKEGGVRKPLNEAVQTSSQLYSAVHRRKSINVYTEELNSERDAALCSSFFLPPIKRKLKQKNVSLYRMGLSPFVYKGEEAKPFSTKAMRQGTIKKDKMSIAQKGGG